jgi:site-specific DNA-methyltransferase (adenine-specific)
MSRCSTFGDKKKGSDTGIDGFIYFNVDKDKHVKGIVSVKGEKTNVKDIRDLRHVLDREKAEIGAFITLESPTKDMVKEAITKWLFLSPINQRDYPKIQIFTIEDLLNAKRPDISHQVFSFTKAEKHHGEKNLGLFAGED